MTDIDEIKREVWTNIINLSGGMGRFAACMQTIDYLHSSGYFGGVPKWQDARTAPKDGTYLMVSYRIDDTQYVNEGVYDHGVWLVFTGLDVTEVPEIDEWQPLPAAPRSELLCSRSQELRSPKGETK